MTAPSTTTDFATLTGTYTFDPAHSRVGFVARHAMVTKVRGAFNEFEGTAVIDGANPANSSATVTVQVASVDTRNAQRDGHLRTNDFLDAENYPQITFVSTAIEHDGGNDFKVTGDLTIKDVTRSVSIDFTLTGSALDPFGNTRVGFEGALAIKRSDWELTWNTMLDTGGVLVSDRIQVEFDVSAIKDA
jgi:polyisoprenoid-binding protein YceI